MADDITQRLGLDASQAIQTLKQLATVTQQYAVQVTNLATATANYNRHGRVMSNILAQLSGGATKTAAQNLNNLATAQNNAAAAAQRSAAAQNQAAQALRQQKLAQVISKGISIPQGATNTQIRQIQSLTGAIAETATRAGVSYRQIQNIANNLGKVYTGPSRKIANDLQRINKLLQDVATQGQNTSKSLTLSWQSVLRIFAIQTIQRALGLLRAAFQDAVRDAINFETQLAQILTIAPTISTLDQARDSVRGLSEEFARPIEDVASGFYNILSNQIGEASDSALVLRQSLILSTAAVSTAADAADALSSIINSYNLNASDAADLTGKLFAAVDVGRFTLDQIANTIGRVTSLAAPLGVSIDEVLASLATLTINGIKADEAMTLLSNALRGILKPTEAMQRAFAELGVANAEAGIATFGLQGFLQKLTETTNGTASEITQLTENIRVGRGVFGVTGKAADQYAKSLEAIQSANAETAKNASNLIINTNAQQIQIELTKLRNFFVDDFGRSALPVLLNLIKAFGGAVNAVKSLIAALSVVGTAFLVIKTGTTFMAAYTAASTSAALATSSKLVPAVVALGRTMLTIPGVIVITAITAAVIALTGALNNVNFDSFNDQLQEAADTANQVIQKAADANTILAKQQQRDSEQLIRARYRAELQLVSQLQRLYDDDVKNATKAQEQILDNLQQQVKARGDVLNEIVKQLEKNISGAGDRIRDVNKEIGDIKFGEQERQFDRSLKSANDLTKAFANLRRSESIRQRIGVANSDDEIKAQEQLLAAAAQRAQQAQDLGDSTGNVGIQVQAERELQRIFATQLELKQRQIDLANKQRTESEAQLKVEQQRQQRARELIKEFDKLAIISKSSGKPIIEREQARATALELAGQLEEVFRSGNRNLSLEEFLGIRELENQLRDSFNNPATGVQSSLTEAVSSGIDVIFDKLSATRDQFAGEISRLEEISGKEFTFVSGFEEVSNSFVDKLNSVVEALNRASSLPQVRADLDKATNQFAAGIAQITNTREAIVKDFTGIFANPIDNARGSAVNQRTQGLQQSLTDRFFAARTSAEAGDPKQALALQQELLAASNRLRDFINLNRTGGPEVEKLTQAQIDKLSALSDIYSTQAAQISEIITKSAELNRINLEAAPLQQEVEQAPQQGIESLKTLELLQQTIRDRGIEVQNSVKGVGPSAASAAQQATENLSTIDTALIRTRDNAIAAANAVASVGGGTVNPQNAARGGLVKYFSQGGFVPKGTDTVPAMLSPGEVVINAKSSRKFYSQLMAINAGRTPIYRQEGGPVTSNTIAGDVVINVQGQQSNKATAREVMQAFRREFRRGTSKI